MPFFNLKSIIDVVRTKLTQDTQVAGIQDDVRQVLRAYWEAVAISEPALMSLWRASGTTLSQLRLLYLLSHEAANAGELARRLGVKASSLSRMLERLEERGLVQREGDPLDRRRVTVSITEAGRRFLGEHARSGAALRRAAEAMTREERALFLRGMEAFLQSVRRVAVGFCPAEDEPPRAPEGTAETPHGKGGDSVGIPG